MTWRSKAKCKGHSPSLFFGTIEEVPSERIRREKQAALFCRGCEVRLDCLDAGKNEEGMWGGLTEAERRRLKTTTHNTAPVIIRVQSFRGPKDVDATGWVLLEQDNNSRLYRRDSETSWHGSEFVVIAKGEIVLVTVDLNAAYIHYRRVVV